MNERRQFRALVKLFGYRFFDTDILSVRGDLTSLLAQFAALLAALSFLIVLAVGPKYAGLYQHLTPAQLRPAALGDQEFLISTSMAIIGVFTLLLWDALFPDRRDCLILGSMPVRVRTLFAAKLAALGAALGIAVAAVNSMSGLVCPFVIVPDGGLRSFAAYWFVILLASAFVFLLLLGVQGLAMHLLPHHLFLRWSTWIQTAAFFAVLTLYFLAPPGAAFLPSSWFAALFQVLTGSGDAGTVVLAHRASASFGLTAVIALGVYALAYARQMRLTVEQSGIVPKKRRAESLLHYSGPEHAILAFIGRTVARSRQHRLLLAIYTGMGLAYVFSNVAYVLYRSRPDAFGAAAGRMQTELAIPFVLLFFLIIGLRVSFSIPIELRANWLFRLTDPFSRGVYLSATRKALLLALAPVTAITALAYLAVWPWPRAMEHTAFVAAFGLLVIELALLRFNKVPFTCSYLPGRANVKIMFAVYWGLLIGISEVVTDLEMRALRDPGGYAVLMGVTLGAWLVAGYYTRGAHAGLPALSFEEQPETAVVGLGLAGQ